MNLQALIFDLDGTLINSEEPEYAGYASIYAQHGHELPLSLWGKAVGTFGGFDPQADLSAKLGNKILDWENLLSRHRAQVLAQIEASGPMLGAVQTLDWAKEKYALALASSSGREWVEDWLKKFELQDFFRAVRTRADVKQAKPAPDLFLAAAEALDLKAENCLAVEDSPNGARAAIAAGMPVVVIPNTITRTLVFPQGVEKLDSLQMLRTFIETSFF